MRVLFLNSSKKGGAFIATNRIIKSVEGLGVYCVLLSQNDYLNDNKIQKSKGLRLIFINLIKALNLLFQKLFAKDSYLSFGIIGTINVKKINESDYDIIHLNWINSGFISLFQISRIKKPIIWTIHDMWLVSGIEHTTDLLEDKPLSFIPKFIQKFKRICLEKKNIIIVSPSLWLKNKVEFSFDIDCRNIPNPIDDVYFKSLPQKNNFDNKFKILFLHYNVTDSHKGFDMLNDALNKVNSKHEIQLISIAKNEKFITKYEFISIPFIQSEFELIELYNSVDLVAVPSKVDNYPSVALEALHCGKPVIGFDLGGLSEMIKHKKNGYLAKPFDIDDLANGIEYLINNKLDFKFSSSNSMNYIGNCYLKIYNEIIEN